MKNNIIFTDTQIKNYIKYKIQEYHKTEVNLVIVTKVYFEKNIYKITYSYIIDGYNYFLYGVCNATTKEIKEVLTKVEKSENKRVEIEFEYCKFLASRDITLLK